MVLTALESSYKGHQKHLVVKYGLIVVEVGTASTSISDVVRNQLTVKQMTV